MKTFIEGKTEDIWETNARMFSIFKKRYPDICEKVCDMDFRKNNPYIFSEFYNDHTIVFSKRFVQKMNRATLKEDLDSYDQHVVIRMIWTMFFEYMLYYKMKFLIRIL